MELSVHGKTIRKIFLLTDRLHYQDGLKETKSNRVSWFVFSHLGLGFNKFRESWLCLDTLMSDKSKYYNIYRVPGTGQDRFRQKSVVRVARQIFRPEIRCGIVRANPEGGRLHPSTQPRPGQDSKTPRCHGERHRAFQQRQIQLHKNQF